MKETAKRKGLNPIDVVIIVVIIAVVAFAGYKLLNREETTVYSTPITFTVRCTGVKPEVYESIQDRLPSQLMASGEMKDGWITAVTAAPHTPSVLTTVKGQPILVEEDGLLDLTFTVEGNVQNLVTMELANQEIRIGKTYTVKTADFELEGGVILTREVGETAE